MRVVDLRCPRIGRCGWPSGWARSPCFAGTQVLTVAPIGDSATLLVDDLPSEAEPKEPGRAVDPGDYRGFIVHRVLGVDTGACRGTHRR